MKTCYVYQADMLCAACGVARREHLDATGAAPANTADESSYDSDDYPKGPYQVNESDSPQHCAECGEFLENALTAEGVAYVREALANPGHIPTQKLWREFYASDLEHPTPLFDGDSA